MTIACHLSLQAFLAINLRRPLHLNRQQLSGQIQGRSLMRGWTRLLLLLLDEIQSSPCAVYRPAMNGFLFFSICLPFLFISFYIFQYVIFQCYFLSAFLYFICFSPFFFNFSLLLSFIPTLLFLSSFMHVFCSFFLL